MSNPLVDGTGEAVAHMKEKNVLVLQGGGALGAYQAGVYEALAGGRHRARMGGRHLDRRHQRARSSPATRPSDRVPRLREFWERVSSLLASGASLPMTTTRARLFDETSAALVAITGAPGFFEPRIPPAVFMPRGSPEAISFYDTAPLLETLRELVDFDLFNSGAVRFSVGAVQVRTGNLDYFDTRDQKIGPEHIMASGALPPGFPPVEIDGEPYWDGGLVSNTPLALRARARTSRAATCAFSRSTCSARRGALPGTVFDIAQREKEIRYSSRTRLNTDIFARAAGDAPGHPPPAHQDARGSAQSSRLASCSTGSAAMRPSPSCTSSTGALPTGRSPRTTSSRATPWTSIGGRPRTTSSARSAIRPGRVAPSPRKA